jgi:hypothetical protein
LLPADLASAGVAAATRFTEARQRAREVIDLLDEGDRAVLVFTAAPLRVPYENPVRDPSLLLEEVQRAATRPSRADLAGALERVRPVLAGAKTLNREIFIISDFQRNQVEEILGGSGAQPARGDSAAPGSALTLPPDTRVYLVPVSAAGTANLAAVGALYESDPAGPGGRLTVRLRNTGETPFTETSVQAIAADGSGRVLGEGYVTVEAGASAQTAFAVPQAPPDGRLVVRSAPDLLERDDARYVVTSETSHFRVLVVTGGPLSDPSVREEARFVLLALDPWRGAALLEPGAEEPAEAGEAPLFEVSTVSETDFGLRGAVDADAVLLLNVGRLSAAGVELLEQFRRDGGGVVMALGDRVDPRLYNTLILPRLAQLRLEDAEGEPGAGSYFALRPSAAGHPVFEGFPVAPGGALTRARFQRLVRVRPGPATRVIAEFGADRPGLVEEPGLLLFASSLDRRWSDFPTSASFLPFLHRALLYVILGGRAGRGDLRVGDALSWPMAREGARAQGPGGIELPLTVAQTDQGPLLRSGPAPEPGFYALGDATLAVNVDTRESDLAPMTEAQAERLFGAGAVRLAPGAAIARQVQETRYGRELWKLCLALAFLVLVAESLIARGRGVS